ncbi:MAG: LamG-like jellyroll fold domain-containing protein [Pseudomonadota bacterium]
MIPGRTINYIGLRNPISAHFARRRSSPTQRLQQLLFGNGEQGVWYEPKPQYLYQDAAGTTPVTADGDPVGLMLDLSGGDNDSTQPTGLNRPLHKTEGGLHWLRFDGISKSLLVLDSVDKSHPYATIGNQCSGFFAVQFDAFSPREASNNWVISSVIHEVRNLGSENVHVPFSIGANGNNLAFGCTSDYTNGANRVNGAATLTSGQAYVIGFVVDGANVYLYLNGVIDATSSSLGNDSRSPNDGVGSVSSRLGARTKDDNSTADNLDGKIIGGVVVDYSMTPTQVEITNNYLASLAGIQL